MHHRLSIQTAAGDELASVDSLQAARTAIRTLISEGEACELHVVDERRPRISLLIGRIRPNERIEFVGSSLTKAYE